MYGEQRQGRKETKVKTRKKKDKSEVKKTIIQRDGEEEQSE
jgi:hypothetical protein